MQENRYASWLKYQVRNIARSLPWALKVAIDKNGELNLLANYKIPLE